MSKTGLTTVLDEVRYLEKHVRVVKNGEHLDLPKYSVTPRNIDTNTIIKMHNGLPLKQVVCTVYGEALEKLARFFQ